MPSWASRRKGPSEKGTRVSEVGGERQEIQTGTTERFCVLRREFRSAAIPQRGCGGSGLHGGTNRRTTGDAVHGPRERPEKFSGSGAGGEFADRPTGGARGRATGRGAIDRVPDFAERAATRSAARGAVQPGEQGNCNEAEHHGAHGEVSHFQPAEQIWSGVAGGFGTAGVWIHADRATGIGKRSDQLWLFAGAGTAVAGGTVESAAANHGEIARHSIPGPGFDGIRFIGSPSTRHPSGL